MDARRRCEQGRDQAELAPVGLRHDRQLAEDPREPSVSLQQRRIAAGERLIEDRPEQDQAARHGHPHDDDQDPHRMGGHRPGRRAGDARQDEQAEQAQDAVDHHRGDRLGAVDVHPHEVGRLDEVAPDGARDHQVEHVADEAQEQRVAEREPGFQHAHQQVPAAEGQHQGHEVQRLRREEQPVVDPVREHLLDLRPVLPDCEPEQREGHGDQDRIDHEAADRVLLRMGHRRRGLFGWGRAGVLTGRPWSRARQPSVGRARRRRAGRGRAP